MSTTTTCVICSGVTQSSASPDAIKTNHGGKRLRSSPPAADQQPAPKLSRPYAATNTTTHTPTTTEATNDLPSGTTQMNAVENTAAHGSVSAQWLLEFEQRILARFDNRFDEVSGRMSRLEEAQARHEATLTRELAEAADFRAACSREMTAFQRELRGEVEAACARIASSTAVTRPREANKTDEDSCEVRFDGLPPGVDPSSAETIKKILLAIGLARFEMHIARVREWINRNPRSADQSSSRQIVVQLSSPFIRDEVIGASPALRDLTMVQIFGVKAKGRFRASPVLPRGVYHLHRRALDLARAKRLPRPFM
uniref:Uncharacterized protein n=1 Tax=Trichogramma kaykai TaxID=54128 RepID=A0ABD2X1N3_9HYME